MRAMKPKTGDLMETPTPVAITNSPPMMIKPPSHASSLVSHSHAERAQRKERDELSRTRNFITKFINEKEARKTMSRFSTGNKFFDPDV